ncbi:hypothetical protein V1511DRAFT_473744 [Dipodascopsis uninucleata]
MMLTLNKDPTREFKTHRTILIEKYGNIWFISLVVGCLLLALRAVAYPFIPKVLRRPIPLWLSVGICSMLFVIYAFSETSSDYISVTKRLGRLAAYSMPFMYFLVLKPSVVPQTPYLSILPMHIWFGRILTIFTIVHGALYLNYYIQVGAIYKLLKIANLLGIVSCLLFILSVVLSLPFIRKRMYEYFYRFHYSFSWLIIATVALHSRPRIWVMMGICLLIMVGQTVIRAYNAQLCKVKVDVISEFLHLVTIRRELLPAYFPPGSHVRLSPSASGSKFWWFLAASHPYSIASSYLDDSFVRFFVKPSGKFQLQENIDYWLTGPYASLSENYFNSTQSASRRVLIIAGGVGLSFAAPIVTALRKYNHVVELVWSVRSSSDLKLLRLCKLQDVNVYVSKGKGLREQDVESYPMFDRDVLEHYSEDSEPSKILVGSSINEDREEAESVSEKEGMSLFSNPDYMAEDRINITFGRMDVAQYIDDYVTKLKQENIGKKDIWLISCGNPTMVSECSKIGRKYGFTIHAESYDI